MTTEFEEGRIAGINEAVSRLTLWQHGVVGEEITYAEHAVKIVTTLLPPASSGAGGEREPTDPVAPDRRHAFFAGWNAAHTMSANHSGAAWHDYWAANLAPWATPSPPGCPIPDAQKGE